MRRSIGVGDASRCARCSRTKDGGEQFSPSCSWTTRALRGSRPRRAKGRGGASRTAARDGDGRLQGEGEHGTRPGTRGPIGPGDVQWMTAAGASCTRRCTPGSSPAGWDAGDGPALGEPSREGQDVAAAGIRQSWTARSPGDSWPKRPARRGVIAATFQGLKGPAGPSLRSICGRAGSGAGAAPTLPLPDGFTTILLVLREGRSQPGRPGRRIRLFLLGREGEGLLLGCPRGTRAVVPRPAGRRSTSRSPATVPSS